MIGRPVLAANWKMNHGPTEARAFMAAFLASYPPRSDRTIVIFPPALSLTAARDSLGPRTDVQLGVQNIHSEAKGAFTGENSAPMARDAGARIALVGHSERRHIFGESDDVTAKKCAIALQHALKPMLCVGEKIDEREKGHTEQVVLRQLRTGLSLVEKKSMSGILITLLAIDSVLLIAAVLLQSGKGGGLAASFGGVTSSADAILGTRQAGNLLTKISWWCGGLFLGLAFLLSLSSAKRGAPRSIL